MSAYLDLFDSVPIVGGSPTVEDTAEGMSCALLRPRVRCSVCRWTDQPGGYGMTTGSPLCIACCVAGIRHQGQLTCLMFCEPGQTILTEVRRADPGGLLVCANCLDRLHHALRRGKEEAELQRLMAMTDPHVYPLPYAELIALARQGLLPEGNVTYGSGSTIRKLAGYVRSLALHYERGKSQFCIRELARCQRAWSYYRSGNRVEWDIPFNPIEQEEEEVARIDDLNGMETD